MKREIFAGDFRDRVVHHLVFNYLNPLCERLFINDTYSCRKGKGTSYGIKRAIHFSRSCSDNYQKKCYVLKIDISGYFMSINKRILYEKIKKVVARFENEIKFDAKLVLWLVEKIIFNDPTKCCVSRGQKCDWVGLPKSKSLFFSAKDTGLPIGNLTSQLFANLYLNDLDHYIKCKLKFQHYGRYVDDLILFSRDKKRLSQAKIRIDKYLKDKLGLQLHAKKIYFQEIKKGFLFLGRVILPYRVYLRKRIKGNLYEKIKGWRMDLISEILLSEKNSKIMSSISAYRGMALSCNSYRLGERVGLWRQSDFLPDNSEIQ